LATRDTFAECINDAGKIVGFSISPMAGTTVSGTTAAPTRLSMILWPPTPFANGINDKGQIVGY
jgi:uncharacterized membrane protein